MITEKHYTEFALSCQWQGESLEIPAPSAPTMKREAKLLHKKGATSIQGWRQVSQGKWVEIPTVAYQVAEFLPIRKRGGPDLPMYAKLINMSHAARAAAHIARVRHLTKEEKTNLAECFSQIGQEEEGDELP